MPELDDLGAALRRDHDRVEPQVAVDDCRSRARRPRRRRSEWPGRARGADFMATPPASSRSRRPATNLGMPDRSGRRPRRPPRASRCWDASRRAGNAASSTSRASAAGSPATFGPTILIATVRPTFVSRARNISPYTSRCRWVRGCCNARSTSCGGPQLSAAAVTAAVPHGSPDCGPRVRSDRRRPWRRPQATASSPHRRRGRRTPVATDPGIT